jgi:hypothetical protein
MSRTLIPSTKAAKVLNKKTLFVVGAGASVEFGLPTGDKLKAEVIKILKVRNDFAVTERDIVLHNRIPKAIQSFVSSLPTSSGRSHGEDIEIAQRIIAQGIDIATSIDSFLATHADNPYVIACGKVAIAEAILGAERESPLRRASFDDIKGFAIDEVSNSWAFNLLRVAFEGHTPHTADQIFKNVSFIVFNYDRCVELAIYIGLRKYFNISHDRAYGIVNSIEILHPYGTVGGLTWQAISSGSDFRCTVSTLELPVRAMKIRTLADGTKDANLVERLRVAVRTSEQAFFIGFGFHKQNIDLLNQSGAAQISRVYGTAFNVTETNADVYSSQIKSALSGNNGLLPHAVTLHQDMKSCDLINEYSALLAS